MTKMMVKIDVPRIIASIDSNQRDKTSWFASILNSPKSVGFDPDLCFFYICFSKRNYQKIDKSEKANHGPFFAPFLQTKRKHIAKTNQQTATKQYTYLEKSNHYFWRLPTHNNVAKVLIYCEHILLLSPRRQQE